MLFSAVEVQAEGLYEASVLGICAFRKHELTPAGLIELEVEVRSTVKHTLSVRKVQDWLQRGVRTPKEAVLKERLRGSVIVEEETGAPTRAATPKHVDLRLRAIGEACDAYPPEVVQTAGERGTAAILPEATKG
jgi:hypothetical protein